MLPDELIEIQNKNTHNFVKTTYKTHRKIPTAFKLRSIILKLI